ncbi:MAG: hypothetical protein Kow00120_30980 [Anaerolineae bacterium]
MLEALRDIPFTLDADALARNVHLAADSDDARRFHELVHEAQRVARPKALYRRCFVEARAGDSVTVDHVTFTSRALRMNLDGVEHLFAFVATCGAEIDQIDIPPDDFMRRFWLDTIKSALLGVSMNYLTGLLDRKYRLTRASSMSPGSGDVSVWPIEQQRELFSLLGDVEGLIGVRLTDSYLMVPNQSVSGVRFPTEVDFQTCQLCQREHCPSRQAPFDMALWASVQQG